MKTRSILRNEKWLLFFLWTLLVLGNGKVWGATNDQTILIPANFAQLAKEVGPTVVNISTAKQVSLKFKPHQQQPNPGYEEWEEFFERFFGGPPQSGQQKLRSLGSGFILSEDGYIVTNYHVVADTEDIQVQLSDNKKFQANIVGLDKKTDLALIKIESKEKLPHVHLGDSDGIEIGDWVVAIGNPFGLSNTVTAGIVSAKGRMLNLGPYDDFIQTDASINPGNSGGPLFNLQGEVVGINSAIVASGQGIGFAVPINIARKIIPQLKESGKVVRGWLGVLIQKVSPELASAFNLKDAKGALVSQVMAGSPAEKTGILQGDILLKYDGNPIEEMTDLPRMVANTPIGKKVSIELIRKNKLQKYTLVIERLEEEKENTLSQNEKDKVEEKPPVLGLFLDELTPELSQKLKVKDSKGVIVKEIAPNSPASDSEIRSGDVITEINQTPIHNLNEFNKEIKKYHNKDLLLLLVLRDGMAYYVTLNQKG